MMPAMPQPTPAPIHDITGPVWFFPYPAWVVVAAGIAFLALVGLLFWLTRRKRPVPALTPRERALKTLEQLRGEAAESGFHRQREGGTFGVSRIG
jgi:hypothetical protein